VVSDVRVHDLESHQPAQAHVLGHINGGHAAGAEPPSDFIRPDAITGVAGG
jgi:hypothetical protein